jgi:hypothetical protein
MLNLFKQVKSQDITAWGRCCKIKLVMTRVGSSEVRECVRCMLTGGCHIGALVKPQVYEEETLARVVKLDFLE